MRWMVVAAVVAWSGGAAADGFRDDLTFENFGERLAVTARIVLPTIPISVEQQRCSRTSEGDPSNSCSYNIAGRPVDVRSDTGRAADWIRVFATADNPDAIALIVEIAVLTVFLLDPEDADRVAEEAYSAASAAARSGRVRTLEASNFEMEFGPDETGNAVRAIFRAR